MRFAGPRATSQWVVLPVIGVLSLNASSVTENDTLEIFALRVIADVAAFFVAWLLFTGVGKLIHRFCSHYGLSRLIALVLLYAATEMSRTTTGHFVTIGFGIPENPDWAFRLSAAAMTGLVFLGISSTLVNDSFLYRETYTQLTTVRLRLEAMVSTSQSALISTRDRLVTRIRQQLESALRSSLDESQRQNPQLSVMTETLFDAVEGVVRPVSRELFGSPLILEQQELPVTPPRMKVGRVFDEATQDAPFKPLAFATLPLMMTLPFILFKAESSTLFLRYIVATVFLVVVLYVAKIAWEKSLLRLPLWVRVIIISVVYAMVALLYTVLLLEGPGANGYGNYLVLVYGAGLGAAVGWLLALISGMHVARIAMLDEVAAKNDELAWLNARMQSELWSEQKRLAMSLHNNVQGMLLAAALKLRAITESNRSEKDLSEVRDLVQKAIDFEFTSHEELTIEAVTKALENSWGELIAISVIADSDTVAFINTDQILVRTLSDVLSEFTTNAIKHGNAKSMSVSIQQLNDRNIEVRLLNDGKPQCAGAREGMGTSFMKAVAVSSSILELPTGFGITLVLPVDVAESLAEPEISAATRA